MKKSFYCIGMALAALATSCSQSETVEMPASNQISFDAAYVGKPVRAAETTTDNLESFQVYGGFDNSFNVFAGVAITKASGWTYTGDPKYWVNDKIYKFAAYAPASVTATPVPADGALNFTTVDVTSQPDLIYATQNAAPTAESIPDKVKFQFAHLLSMMKLTFTSGFASDCTITISDLSVTVPQTKGNYTGKEGTWALVAEGNTPQTFTTISDEEAIAPSNTAASDQFIVLPCVTDDVTVGFTAVVEQLGAQVAKKTFAATINPSWAKGNRYNYNVTLDPTDFEDGGEGGDDLNKIEFDTPAVDPWVDQSAGEVTIE